MNERNLRFPPVLGCGSGGKWYKAKKWSSYKEMQV